LPVVVSRNVCFINLSGKVKLTNLGKGVVKLGFGDIGIVDKKYRRFLWENNGEVVFDGRVDLGVGTKIANSGSLYFGDNCRINGNSDIVCTKSISFMKNSLISWECLIMDTDFHNIYKVDDENKTPINPNKGIIIGEHSWVGTRCTILKGASLPKNSIVAACSLIIRGYDNENCIYATNGIIKENVMW